MENFKILAIRTNLAEKNIVIETTLDIDPDTIGYDSVKITEKESKRIIDYTAEVKFDKVTLHLEEWPTPNVEYLLKVQHVESVMGDKLPASLQRRIYFESELESRVEIISPANFEKISELSITLREIPLKEEAALTGSFYIQIARENSFYTTIKDTLTENENIILSDLKSGQYYIRARVEKDGMYSAWSETSTFTIEEERVSGHDHENNDHAPVLDLGLKLISSPREGETPELFLISFDHVIDPYELKVVSVIKRTGGITTEEAFTYKVFDNNIEITLKSEKPQDNSYYEISLKNIYAMTRDRKLEELTVSFMTAFSPMYCIVDDVKSVLHTRIIDERTILFNIRDASRYVDYILETSFVKTEIPYAATQYVKYRAGYESLIKKYSEISELAGKKGSIGKVSFESAMPDLKPLLDELKEQMGKWEIKLLGGNRALFGSAIKAIGARHQVGGIPSNYQRGAMNGMARPRYPRYHP